MMVAQRSSALPYESIPTEDVEVPTTFTYRNADSRTPTVTHHPIPMGPHHPDRSTWVTCTLVTVLVVLASILGIIVGFAAQRAHYPAIFSVAEGITPDAGGSGGVAHGSSWGKYGGYESGSSSEKSVDSWSNVSGKGGGDTTTYSWEKVSTQTGTSRATESTWTAPPVVVIATTQATSLPPTATTTAPTTTTPSTPAPTTTAPTTPVPTTASQYSVTMVTTTAMLSTTPPGAVGEKESSSQWGSTTDDVTRASSASVVTDGYNGSGVSSASVVTDGYNSSLGVIDYMVVMQKKLPVGLVLTILLAVILVTVGSLAAIIYVVKRKTTKKRRRAHVRRAINELRAQDKLNLMQSDEEEG